MGADVVHMRARVIGPRALRLKTEVVEPVLEGELFLAALFVHRSEIEVRVGVIGNETDGAGEMRGSSVEIAEFVERAAEIEMRDGVIGKNRERLAK